MSKAAELRERLQKVGSASDTGVAAYHIACDAITAPEEAERDAAPLRATMTKEDK